MILAVVINTTRRADPKLCKRALELTCDLRVVAAIEPGCCWTRKTLVSRTGFKEKFLKERKIKEFFCVEESEEELCVIDVFFFFRVSDSPICDGACEYRIP